MSTPPPPPLFSEVASRIIVGAAGIMVETFLAAAAMIVWVLVGPGFARRRLQRHADRRRLDGALGHAISPPHFDGYYVLADLIEIPNLGARANAYMLYLLQRHAFGVDHLVSPATAPGEAPWFVAYATASFFYRMSVTFGIALFIGSRLFVIGILLALWGLVAGLALPLAKGVHRILFDPQAAAGAGQGDPLSRACRPRSFFSW